jgi:uncharacterized protein (TIGR03067 family)
MRKPEAHFHRVLLLLASLLLSLPGPSVLRAEAGALTGTWLPQRAEGWHKSNLGSIRQSKFVLTSRSFTLSHYRGLAKDITGTFALDPTSIPQKIDLRTDAIDLSPSGAPVKYPPCILPGIYKIEGDLLTVCFQTGSDPVRPRKFDAATDDSILLVLRRADASFRDYPKLVSLTVIDPGGRPAPDQSVFQFMRIPSDAISPAPVIETPYSARRTDASGTTTVAYDEFAMAGVRDRNRKLIGFTTASPALLQEGAATIKLQPECLLTGSIVCAELTGAGKPLGWTNVYLQRDGERIAECASTAGHYEFPVAPGEYILDAYGTNLRGKYVSVTVPAGGAEFRVPPIALTASHLDMLKGHPAPEFSGIVGWKGKPVKLADLRGKYVLIDFWGYWCGPCVHAMPLMIDLDDRYKDKGLAVLSVHVDVDGDVDTAAKLDEKIAGYKSSLWGGKDLPFPTALSIGKATPEGYDGIPANQYGVLSLPTTILIDRAGNVVGEFVPSADASATYAQIERLLGLRQ